MNLSEPTPNLIPPQMSILQMASGYWLSQCIYVAAKLGIADLLKDGSQHCDEPYVIEKAQHSFETEAVRERCELVGGDFFESAPAGGDAYILKHIIHDWDDERAVKILQCCHQAMEKQGRLLVVEPVIPPGNEPFVGKWVDLNMLVMTSGGRERTEAEYRELFKVAGFKLTQVFPTQSDVSVIEGVPIRD